MEGIIMQTRVEVDSLGKKRVPKEVYYGIQTLRAVENFPVSGIRAPTVFVRAYVMVKKVSAIANMQVGWLDRKIGEAILKACDEVLAGKFLDQFIVDVFEAGAGTSFNMNVNEVLANCALEILGKNKGDYKSVSPNDHVNMAQSTNDTFPTAIHIAALIELQLLMKTLKGLIKAFDKLSRKYSHVIKSGRTHLQDALPITIGQEFGGYVAALKKVNTQVRTRSRLLEELALGGTAVGTGVNAHEQFKKIAVSELRRMTRLKLRVAENPFEALQSRNALGFISGALKELALELIRIANDLRLLSSGPTTGLSEVELFPVQPGSSIMPGKVNPVMAECLDMIAFQIVGNDLALSLAVQAGQLDLNIMMPSMMYNILQSIQLLTNFLPVFTEKCVEKITVDEKRCSSYVENNPSLAVFLSPYIGYLEASKIAKQALKEKRPVKEIALERGILTPQQIEEIFNPDFLLGKKRRK
ncbi:MAG TPA: aspartate ammonia-lyase [Candidatus Bathyarchaeia archaeon]|nr:aspartate ammonia-lyase [Candidatus Bathyarchaeia archaeon]